MIRDPPPELPKTSVGSPVTVELDEFPLTEEKSLRTAVPLVKIPPPEPNSVEFRLTEDESFSVRVPELWIPPPK